MPDFSPRQRPSLSGCWADEEAFSAWLAEEENIQYLREVLGLQGLVAEELEHEVEGYFVDIYARDETFDVEVVVENQFGRSDHDHWGKANTYSSNLGADVIVWIAGEFTDGHLEAVRDHNETADRAVFALRAEVLEIEGCDRTAFHLVTEVEPTEWRYSEELKLGVYQEKFFEEFVAFADEEDYAIFANGSINSYSSSTSSEYNLSIVEGIPKSKDRFSLRATRTGLAVRLEINKDDDHIAFDAFEANRQEIVEELRLLIDSDVEIAWERGSEGKIRDIITVKYSEDEFDLRDVNRYEIYHRWLLSATEALRSVFDDRIRNRER
ncbi:DUF4268 domain-containing protein [Halorubellus sp. PRR65]|uniref:DUF4268 domain-containing protein n=1 Tax=Halorubellus sp. PRR65 TaxID=3098148 RepID=UPI002B263D41|nr:DUF4268 domain-containing protein [Halorubellus sp. PRR65]